MKAGTKTYDIASDSIHKELRDAIGTEKVKDDDVVLVTYSFDAGPTPFQKPSLVVFPENAEDVKAILRIANKHRVSVTVMSGGVNNAGFCIPSENGIVADLRRMDKIIEINTDSGYAVIEPGVIFDRFTAALAEKGFRCQIPTAPGGATPLGNYLKKPAGSLATRHLDSILDLEVALPDGTVFNTGSSHFPYVGSSVRYGPFPDLAGLFCCAYGTLGVVTKASVRIYPINEANRVNIAVFDSFASAVDFSKDIINNNIPEHCIIWSWQLYRAFESDFLAESGPRIQPELKLDPKHPPKGIPYVLVTSLMSGYEKSMATNEELCKEVAMKYGGKALTKEEVAELLPGAMKGWSELYLKYHPVESTFFSLGKYIPWIVVTEPKDVKDLEKWAVEEVSKLGVWPVCYYAQPFDFGRSIMYRIFCFPDPQNHEEIAKVAGTFEEMFETAMQRYGAIPIQHSTQFPWLPKTDKYHDVLKSIKKTLDPNNILNRDVGLF